MAGWIHAITESLATLAMTVGSPFYTSLATVPWPVPGSDEYVRFYSYEDPCAHTPNGDSVVFSTLSGTGCWLQWKPRIDGTQVTTALGFTPYSATNPSGFITSSALSPYATTTSVTSALAGKENAIAAGTTGQYWRGDKTWQAFPTIPTIPSRSFNYATRPLNACFQVSSTRDALVTYSVDIATSLSLVAGQQGTVYLETFADSGCTTGTQELTRFVNGQTGTLTVGLALQQNVTGTLTGVIPAGSYVRLRTQNNTGTPTFTARPGQETLL